MARPGFTFEVLTSLSADEAWRRVVDVSRHGDVVPFTVGSGPTPDEACVGSHYVARTALGPVGFDDVMVVRALEPGRTVIFEKVGRLLGGTVDVSVRAVDGHRTRVRWRQSIVLPWVPRPLTPVVEAVVRVAAPIIGGGYERVVHELLARR